MKKGTNLVIHWHKRLPPAMAYVMMGRVQDLENLYIANDFDARKIRCNKKALEEAIRIEKISLSWKCKDACFLSVASMNIRSLPKHFKDLKADYKMMQKDLICLQETWLTSQQETDYVLDEFEAHHLSVGRGKGLVTYSKVPVEERVNLFDEDATFQLITTKVKGITIISFYISPHCSNLETIVDYLSKHKTKKCLLIGDFNFTPQSSNILTRQLKNWNFCQIIQSPTHRDGNIIDHAYISEALSTSTFPDIHYVYYSDHQGILRL